MGAGIGGATMEVPDGDHYIVDRVSSSKKVIQKAKIRKCAIILIFLF